jgi:hypothetical protein
MDSWRAAQMPSFNPSLKLIKEMIGIEVREEDLLSQAGGE